MAAACSQGTAIPGLIGDLAAEAGIELAGTSTKKGGFWVIGLTGGVADWADYYPGPSPAL